MVKQWYPEMLFPMHLECVSEFSGGQQNRDWLFQKSSAYKSKFEMDRHDREANLAKKRAAEKDERKEAAKNSRLFTESSTELRASLKQFNHTMQPYAGNITAVVEENNLQWRLR
jgi:hypothetical protein